MWLLEDWMKYVKFQEHSGALFFLEDLFIYIIYFWLRWVFVAARGLSLVVASGGYS